MSLSRLKFIEDVPAGFTCSKLTIETVEQGVKYVQVNNMFFIVKFEYISHLALVFLLLTLNM